MSREFDVVVWGATGFTGKWVAKHLGDNYLQSELKWAIAGRSEAKLKSVDEFLALPQDKLPDHIIADSHDRESLSSLVQKTKVIISTVGPYALYGSLLVELCAKHGTDYVDLTGETPWIRKMIDSHLDQAKASGARIVHCCGFDSIPSDIGVFYTQQQAKNKFGKELPWIRYHLMKSQGGASGGTVASLINVVKEAVADKTIRKLLMNPYSLNPDNSFRGPDKRDQNKVQFSDEIQAWTAPFVMEAINTRVVRRSNALMDFKYGEDFQYSETMRTGKGAKGYMSAKMISAVIKTIMMGSVSAVGRKVLSWFLPAQGEGPTVDQENPGFYHIRFVAKGSNEERIDTMVSGDGDPGYGSTSKMLAESAVCLALDEPTTEGGIWTPASAMGEKLMARLADKGGLSFSVIEE